MKIISTFFCALFCLTLFAQPPAILKTVGGTVTEPHSKDQNGWINNLWNSKRFYQGTGTPTKLCITDGTDAGTVYLKDIGSGTVLRTIPAQSFIYIITTTVTNPSPFTHQEEIWRSDGTAAGTVFVKAIDPIVGFSTNTNFVSDINLIFNYSVDGDVMYFAGNDGANGIELWRTDGTLAGTYLVKDIRPGTGNSNPSGFCKVGNSILFRAALSGLNYAIWKTDGTPAGTEEVTIPGLTFWLPYTGKINNKMVFWGYDAVNGAEPWVTDGTVGGTSVLTDVVAGSIGSLPSSDQNLQFKFNDNYLFWLSQDGARKDLWRTDGTVAGTLKLTPTDLAIPNNISGGGYSAIAKNGLYWIGNTQQLFFSDGTVGGTKKISGTLNSIQYMTVFKGAAWFHGRDDLTANAEPWRSDGTSVNTARAFEVQPGGLPSEPYGFFELNNELYFFSAHSSGRHLYQYNGNMTFNGSINNTWSDSLNWNSSMPPGITDSVFINTAFTPTVSAKKAYAGTVMMQNGAGINLVAVTDTIFVHDNLSTATGNTITGNGILALKSFNGDTVMLNGGITAANINVQGFASLSGNVSVNNNINLTSSARLLLNNSNLTLTGTSSTITNTAGNYIVTNGTGNLAIENVGAGARTGAVNFPIGTSANYNPVLLTNSGTADVLSARVNVGLNASYAGETPNGAAINSNAVNATWFINEGTAGGSNVTVNLQWNGVQELSGFDRTISKVGHYTGSWQMNTISAAAGADPYTQSGSGYTSFSPFSVFSGSIILPVSLLRFDARVNNNKVDVSWSTATETNSNYFTLERSADGITYNTIATIAAAGTSNNTKNYFYKDGQPLSGVSFYRLKETSMDGATKIYSVVKIKFDGNGSGVHVYPNPLKNTITVDLHAATEKVEVQIINMAGQMLMAKTYKNVNRFAIDLPFASGMYLLKIKAGNQFSSLTLIKE